MKTAQESASKFVERAGVAAGEYAKNARSTTKDQAALAIAAAGRYASEVQAAITRGAFAKGLQKAGKQAWLDGVEKKGQVRFPEGVRESSAKYAANSGKYDAARNAAANLPKGAKASEAQFARSRAVALAQRAVKTA